MHTRTARTLLALMAPVCVLAACDRSDTDEFTDRVDTAFGNVTDRLDSLGHRLDSLGRRIVREYTNAELLGFVDAYNDTEIGIASVARRKATDPQVRTFAERIVREHTALKSDVASAAQTVGATPVIPRNDEDLLTDHRNAMRDLEEKARGNDWDEAYLEHEIKMHRKVLDEIEDALRGNNNEAIRPLLEKMRTGIQEHLKMAEELEDRIGN